MCIFLLVLEFTGLPGQLLGSETTAQHGVQCASMYEMIFHVVRRPCAAVDHDDSERIFFRAAEIGCSVVPLWHDKGAMRATDKLGILVMVALWNRAEHYIFALWFLLSSFFFLFSSPNLSR